MLRRSVRQTRSLNVQTRNVNAPHPIGRTLVLDFLIRNAERLRGETATLQAEG